VGYEIVPYRPALRPGIVGLYRHLIGCDDARNDSYFRWKHEENPYTAEPLVYAALIGGEVAGIRGFQGARWQIGESDVTADWLAACDLVIHPRHRGRKLFDQIMSFALADLARRGYELTLSWSANPITRALQLRSGWQLVGDYATWQVRTLRASRIYNWSRRLRHLPLVWRATPPLLSAVLPPSYDRLDAAWAKCPDPNLQLAREPLPDAMSELAQGARSARIRHVRTPRFYRWRYRNPLSDYRFMYWREARVEGFMVLSLWRDGNGADIRILDWEASRPEILHAMLRRLAALGGCDTLSIWTATLGPECRKVLLDLGFEARDESRGDAASFHPGLMVIGADSATVGGPGLHRDHVFQNLDRWDLRMAHSDAY